MTLDKDFRHALDHDDELEERRRRRITPPEPEPDVAEDPDEGYCEVCKGPCQGH